MDHPDVRARLEEAALRPGGLDVPMETDVARHLDGCAACTAERDALRATAVALDLAIGPPAGARERVLANVRELGRERRPGEVTASQAGDAGRSVAGERSAGGWLDRLSPRLAAAGVAAAIVLFVAGVLASLVTGLGRDDEAAARLDRAMAAMVELSAEPGVTRLALTDPAGASAGMVLHDPSTARLAVMSRDLPGGADADYWCYLERAGERIRVGPMHRHGGTYFWAGPMAGPPDAGRPGDRFLVLDEASGGLPALVGEF